jgi:hypothetical protein
MRAMSAALVTVGLALAAALGGDAERAVGYLRTNGCGIADWQRAMPLLPRPG